MLGLRAELQQPEAEVRAPFVIISKDSDWTFCGVRVNGTALNVNLNKIKYENWIDSSVGRRCRAGGVSVARSWRRQ